MLLKLLCIHTINSLLTRAGYKEIYLPTSEKEIPCSTSFCCKLFLKSNFDTWCHYFLIRAHSFLPLSFNQDCSYKVIKNQGKVNKNKISSLASSSFSIIQLLTADIPKFSAPLISLVYSLFKVGYFLGSPNFLSQFSLLFCQFSLDTPNLKVTPKLSFSPCSLPLKLTHSHSIDNHLYTKASEISRLSVWYFKIGLFYVNVLISGQTWHG